MAQGDFVSLTTTSEITFHSLEALYAQLKNALHAVQDPLLHQSIISLGFFPAHQPGLHLPPQQSSLQFCWGYPLSTEQQQELKLRIHSVLHEIYSACQPQLQINYKPARRAALGATKNSLANIGNLIAVASGKGGVGKSTITTQLALALRTLDLRVGLLDADIYGPNQPHLLGAGLDPIVPQQQSKQFTPQMLYGICSMSIGYLINTKTALVWRGPMISAALQQLLNDTQWPNLDCMLVDMPPGTGDIQLTLSKKYPLSGAVIVTTPQPMALLDARRAIEMFQKVKVPILGVIENMSHYHCQHCQHQQFPFGQDGAAALAQEYGVPLLSQIPLSIAMRDANQIGNPELAQSQLADDTPQDLSQAFTVAARRMLAELARQPLNYQAKFPKVVVE